MDNKKYIYGFCIIIVLILILIHLLKWNSKIINESFQSTKITTSTTPSPTKITISTKTSTPSTNEETCNQCCPETPDDTCCVSFQKSIVFDNGKTLLFQDPTQVFHCEVLDVILYYGEFGESEYLAIKFRATGPDPRLNNDIDSTTITSQTGSNPENKCTNKTVYKIEKPYISFSQTSDGVINGTINFQLKKGFENFQVDDIIRFYYNSWGSYVIGKVIPFNGVKTFGSPHVDFSDANADFDGVCNPPMLASVANEKITIIQNSIKKQSEQLNNLEKYIADIESRYQISFLMGDVSTFDNYSSYNTPGMTITGVLQQPIINLKLLKPRPGDDGPQGKKGPDGSRGPPGLSGLSGKQGYWGIMGVGK